MLLRNLLLAIGALAIVVGVGIAVYLGLHPGARPPPTAMVAAQRAAIMVADRPIPAGALLREDDMGWREIEGKVPPAGSLPRSQVSKAQFVGAVTRRSFAVGEMITAGSLVPVSDQRFLAAVLAPGRRAVTIAVDAPQSASGLIQPGDRVDVILVQASEQSGPNAGVSGAPVAQVLLRDIRVVAVDRNFHESEAVAAAPPPRSGAPAAPAPGAPAQTAPPASQQAALPRTITLELTRTDAQRLFVAQQLGRIEISLRAFASTGGEAGEVEPPVQPPVWSAEVSAVRAAIKPAEQPAAEGARPAAAPIQRRASAPAPIHILRGSKAEAQ